jgi:hypothetical protein
MNIVQALSDENLLGAAIGDLRTWKTWTVVLKAAFGLRLRLKEMEIFHKIAGDREPPKHRVRELWILAGRRSGKSKISAALACYLALLADGRKRLTKGEEGFVIVLAPSRQQARIIHRYVKGYIEASPLLAAQVVGMTSDEVRLSGGVTIACHANSYRTVRGTTLLGAIFDEVAYWRSEESATPDLETARAVAPALSTVGGMMVGISSPYRRLGLLANKYRDFYGKSNDDALVLQSPTELFNPTIDRSIVAAAHVDDPESARSEWDAEFRSDLNSLLDDQTIDAAIDRSRPLELPPQPGQKYFAHTDPSGGRHDAYTCCIGHRSGGQLVVDAIRGIRSPSDPAASTAELAKLLKDYGVTEIVGDRFSGNWVSGAWADNGIIYKQSELTASELYLEVVPQFARGVVSIPDHPRLIRELRLLERRTHRSGKDSVSHPSHGSDDHANALAGLLWLIRAEPAKPMTFAVPVVLTRPRETVFETGPNPQDQSRYDFGF